MTLSLHDVRRDSIANRALTELMHDYTVAEQKGSLVLTKKEGNLTLFFNELDDLHQWEFVQNKKMVNQSERLRALLTKIHQAAGRVEDPRLDSRGAITGSNEQNQQQWQRPECP